MQRGRGKCSSQLGAQRGGGKCGSLPGLSARESGTQPCPCTGKDGSRPSNAEAKAKAAADLVCEEQEVAAANHACEGEEAEAAQAEAEAVRNHPSPRKMTGNHYKILGQPRIADHLEIRRKSKKPMRKYHPDK